MEALTILISKLSDRFDTFLKRVDALEDLYLNHRHKGFDKSKTLTPKCYSGFVNADGTAGSLPMGWSSTKTGTGAYTVTHNLNLSDYAVVMTGGGSQIGIFATATRGANSFTCVTDNNLVAATDCAFNFILVPIR